MALTANILCIMLQQFFSEIQAILLNSQSPERCTNSVIQHESELHQDILIVLDTTCSKLCKRTGEAVEKACNVFEVSIANLNLLSLQANLSFTPQLHSTLEHLLDHMGHFNGIADMLEDDVEHIHLIAAKIEAWVRKSAKANVHSKMEAMQNSREIQEATEKSV